MAILTKLLQSNKYMKFDVIVVLAGGITKQGTLPKSVMQRVEQAKKLYEQGYAPKVLMSGQWSSYWQHSPPAHTEAVLMYQYAIRLGIPSKVLLVEEHSQNTFENAFYISKLFLEPRKWKKIVVITSDFHIARTQHIFNRLLGKTYQTEFIGAPADEGLMKQLRWRLKESLLSNTQWLFQHAFYCR